MTFGRVVATHHHAVKRLWSLMMILVASSLVMATTVHARELPGKVTIDCTGTVAASADVAHAQGNNDQDVPHRHGTCHGPVMQVPASDANAAPMQRITAPRYLASAGSIPSRLVDPALRPPTA